MIIIPLVFAALMKMAITKGKYKKSKFRERKIYDCHAGGWLYSILYSASIISKAAIYSVDNFLSLYGAPYTLLITDDK